MNDLLYATMEIKNNISALDVAEVMGWDVTHGRCKCPIHNGGDKNCRLYPGNKGFHCFSCGASGDVIKLVQDYYKTSFRKTVSWFNDTFHMGLNLKSTITTEQRRQAENAQRMRKSATEHREWKSHMEIEVAMAADLIVEALEEQRDMNVPKTANERWNPQFCEAVRMMPEAQRFAEDCMMDCIESERENVKTAICGSLFKCNTKLNGG